MAYSNGATGVCECGQLAVVSCKRCGRSLCDRHARALPPSPVGVSPDALGRYEVAIRVTNGPHCESCRAELGSQALAQASSAPRAPLPDHWLDRAIALSSDGTRSDAEKLQDAALPASLTAQDVAREFLRRIERAPQERVPISPPSMFRAPEFIEGWSVDCRRTEYTAHGSGRHRLPCLISVGGELLGPVLEEGGRQGQTWWVVPDSDIELARLVTGVAQLLVLSTFMPPG